jgi:hypothetical protein
VERLEPFKRIWHYITVALKYVANLGPSDGVQTLPSLNVDKWNAKNSLLIGGYNAENVPKSNGKSNSIQQQKRIFVRDVALTIDVKCSVSKWRAARPPFKFAFLQRGEPPLCLFQKRDFAWIPCT